ncbi:unnamed protein product [Pedinophyceae sp. YPF-701]|nr:unnamed protein product [Pedinophyceae sp. YPF-701]
MQSLPQDDQDAVMRDDSAARTPRPRRAEQTLQDQRASSPYARDAGQPPVREPTSLSGRPPRPARPGMRPPPRHPQLPEAPEGTVRGERLDVEIVSCDGGAYSDTYSFHNILQETAVCYSSCRSRGVNIVLRCRDGGIFNLSKVVARAPVHGYTNPLAQAVVFTSFAPPNLVEASRYDGCRCPDDVARVAASAGCLGRVAPHAQARSSAGTPSAASSEPKPSLATLPSGSLPLAMPLRDIAADSSAADAAEALATLAPDPGYDADDDAAAVPGAEGLLESARSFAAGDDTPVPVAFLDLTETACAVVDLGVPRSGMYLLVKLLRSRSELQGAQESNIDTRFVGLYGTEGPVAFGEASLM